MRQKTPLSVYVVSMFLLVYTVMISLDAPVQITGFVLFLSPFLMAWLTLSVLKMKTRAKELSEKEEWGYADKDKEELGMF